MADRHIIDELRAQYDNLSNLNLQVISKYHLGERSIINEVNEIVNDVKVKVTYILSNYSIFQNDFVAPLSSIIANLINLLNSINGKDDSTFLQERETLLVDIRSIRMQFLRDWVFIQSTVIDSKNLLEKDNVNIEKLKNNILRQAQDEFQTLKNNTLTEINNAQTSSINLINDRELKLKEKIQKTARKISVESAQKQFEEECKRLKGTIKVWSCITSIIVIVFGVLAYIFYTHTFFTPEMKSNADLFNDKFIDIMRWESIFHTVIRVAVLAIIGTIIAFCLKMLRANLHLYQHNLHRQRIANSIEAFVNAALTDDQSDKILEKLVEAVVSFGQSGLIQNEDDSIHASKLTIDSITKTLTSK